MSDLRSHWCPSCKEAVVAVRQGGDQYSAECVECGDDLISNPELPVVDAGKYHTADAKIWLKDPASWNNSSSEYIHELEAERDRLRARLARIVAAHRQWEDTPWCDVCRKAWPCPTRVWAVTDRDPAAPWDPAEYGEARR